MGTINALDNIIVTKLKIIDLKEGKVLHAMKKIDIGFNKFGEIYFSHINYNLIKAWKKHNKMIMNLIVPIGNVKFVFYSDLNNKFREEIIGANRYVRLTVPSNIWFGFKGLDKEKNLIVNIADITHNPNEMNQKILEDIPYNW